MNATVIGLIAIPVAIFLLGAIFAAVKGAIRFAQYLVRSEESQESMARSNAEIAKTLRDYMAKNDAEIRALDRRVAIHEGRLGRWLAP